MITVEQAIEILQNANPEAILFLSSDEEGNSYRPADISLNETMCDQDNEWISCHPDDIRNGEYEGWEDKMVKAVVIW